MAKYTVRTDGFLCDDFECDSLDEAIAYAFDGEGLGKITDEESLRRKFQKYVADGGWCWVEEDGECVIEIGDVG